MHIEQSAAQKLEEVESELRQISVKLEVKSSVLEFATEKAAHYMTLTERLRIELRDLTARKAELEEGIRRSGLQLVK